MRIRLNLSTALIASAAMGVVFCLAAIRMTGQADATKQPHRPARTSDRTSQLERHLAGDDDRELGPAGPFDASGSSAARRVPRCSGAGGARARFGLGRRRAARPRCRGRRRDSVQARSCREKERECRTLARSRPGSPLLYAGNSAGDVYALSVSDHAGHEQDRDVVRIRRREPHHSPRPRGPAAGRHVDGPFGRATGKAIRWSWT